MICSALTCRTHKPYNPWRKCSDGERYRDACIVWRIASFQVAIGSLPSKLTCMSVTFVSSTDVHFEGSTSEAAFCTQWHRKCAELLVSVNVVSFFAGLCVNQLFELTGCDEARWHLCESSISLVKQRSLEHNICSCLRFFPLTNARERLFCTDDLRARAREESEREQEHVNDSNRI